MKKLSIIALAGLIAVVGCQPRKSELPSMPTNLTAERIQQEQQVRVSWNGAVTNYDFQQSSQDDTGNWGNAAVESLVNPPKTSTGKYLRDKTAFPQPMRFRVKSVQGVDKSDWTEWVTNSPTQ